MKSLAEIADALQGYDPNALPAQSVNAFLASMVPAPTQSEELPLMQALGRVLAQDIISPIDVPPHDNSAMDGYAFDGSALAANRPLQLQVAGSALAGAPFSGRIGAGQCLRIMTGAILPPGLDTVLPQELAKVHGPYIEVAQGSLQAGDNRRLRGEDVKLGDIALSKGSVLSPAAMGLLASLGLPTAPVFRKLRVAYFSTGDEILSLGDSPREGSVFDSNRYTVWGML